MKRLFCWLALALLAFPVSAKPVSLLRFQVTLGKGMAARTRAGRLLVVMSQTPMAEPRQGIGRTGMDANPIMGRDVNGFSAKTRAVLDGNAAIFPLETLAALPPGDYFVQAVLDDNPDIKAADAPGNLYSGVLKTHLDPKQRKTVKLSLTRQIPAEQTPGDTEYVKWVKLPSNLLTRFYGRPIFLRAAVIVPQGWAGETTRRYPLRVHIGGFGTRAAQAFGMMAGGFRRTWLADDTPRMLYLLLDGAGPLGDCYQINSANNGPYGDAVTQELIPAVEQKFRGNGTRWTDGGSTGGWVALALQIFYPDFFAGAWAGYPDPVDFRGYQLVNLYADKNAYLNARGFETPAARDVSGDVQWTVRHECRMENVLGMGDCYTTSGGQWGVWNAVFGARGPDGRPVPFWNPKTGMIDPAAVESAKKYDLRRVLEENWPTLAPKLRGKMHLWVGDADTYFLNNAVHRLDTFLSSAAPPAEARIVYGPRQPHGWTPLTEKQLMDEMTAAAKP